jgi:hypothetical protein
MLSILRFSAGAALLTLASSTLLGQASAATASVAEDAHLAQARQRNADLLRGDFTIPAKWQGVHPRLYATEDELARTAAYYRQNPAAFASALPTATSVEMTARLPQLDERVTAQRSSLYIARLAVAYRITGDKQYHARLREWLPILVSYQPPAMESIGDNVGLTAGHILLGASIAYDVLKGQGDLELERALYDLIVKQGDRAFRDIVAMKSFPYEQNHLVIPVCGLAIAAMTVADTHAPAAEWGVLSNRIMERSIQSLAYDGWFFEGISYWNYTMQFPVSYAVALQRVMGTRVIDAPMFRLTAEYLSHMTLPDPFFVFDFGDWGPRVESDGVSAQYGFDFPWHTLTSSVKKFVPKLLLREDPSNALLRNFLQRTAAVNQETTSSLTIDAVFEMLMFNPDDVAGTASTAVGELPKPYHYFPDMEVVHWRNDWANPNATAIAFKSGPPAGHNFTELLRKYSGWRHSLGHAHPDAGAFILFGQGKFLANDTGYTGVKETADHNSILVDGIGQHQGGTAWATFNGKPYEEYNKIRMDNVWLADRVVASTAVYEAAYDDALQLEKMRRHLIMIDGRFLVVFDEMASAVEREYEWRWHTDQPSETIASNRFVMTNGNARITTELLNQFASASVAPTIIDANIYPKNPPRLQQRGYHLAMKSPRAKAYEFLTATCIQTANEAPSSFRIVKRSDRSVTMTDGQKECTVWFGGDPALDGQFAYVVRGQDGRVESVGVSGKSLKADGIVIELETPGQFSATTNADGSFAIQSGVAPAKFVTPKR